jgi:hypothetical protein
MTDPQQYAAEQIGQMADSDSTAGASEAAIAASAPSGLGTTSVDIDALAEQIKAMQARLEELESGPAAGDAVAGTVATIQHFLTGHGDPAAIELGDQLAAAAAAQDHAEVVKVAAQLARQLDRNAPYPGENYHYNNARAFVTDLPDVVAAAQPKS